MKREAVAGAIAAWLSSTLHRDDYYRGARYRFFITGRSRRLCLIPLALGKHSSPEDRDAKARAEAGGCRVEFVHSVAEAELAIGTKRLAELIERRAYAEQRRHLSRRELELIVAMAAVDPVQYQLASPAILQVAA